MGIKTVRDYLESKRGKGLEFCFQSSFSITDYSATIYSIVEKPSDNDAYLHVRPLNGSISVKERIKKGLPDTVHIPIKQHLDDPITNIPPQEA